MTISRWKLMAAFLGLSAGGLAMCCAQTSPVSPPSQIKIELDPPSAKTILPEVKATAEKTIEIVLPTLAMPNAPDILPVRGEEKKNDVEKKPVAPASPVAEIPSLSGSYEPPALKKEAPKTTPSVHVSELDLDPVAPPKPSAITTEPVKIAPPPVSFDPIETKAPAKLIVTEVPVQKAAPKPEAKPEATAPKLKMLLRMGTGSPRFEIRSTQSEELLFKVSGEKIEMQSAPDGGKGSPLAGVTASGKVKFSGPGVEGTCDSLTLLSGTGEVLMKGNVQLKTKTGRAWSELASEKMMYQIGHTGLKATGGEVKQTSYRE